MPRGQRPWDLSGLVSFAPALICVPGVLSAIRTLQLETSLLPVTRAQSAWQVTANPVFEELLARAGVSSYVTKTRLSVDLIPALHEVMLDTRLYPDRYRSRLGNKSKRHTLFNCTEEILA
jgi:hypothetical protein